MLGDLTLQFTVISHFGSLLIYISNFYQYH